MIDGVSNAKAKEDAQYTFSNIRSDHKIEVFFEVVTFTIVSSVGEGGTMSPNQITTIKNWGESHEVTYTPNEKYVISTIIVDGEALNLSGVDVSKPYTYTFSKITANHVISCQFESTQRTLTYDPNGGAFADGDSSKTQEYNAFSNQTISLISTNPVRTGYNFKGWNTLPDGSGKGNSELTGAIYSSVFGKEDGWLYAIWEIKQFTITTEAGAHGTISKSMTVDWGTTATVEMKPDDGYRVATYSIDGGNAITSTAKAGNSDYYTFRNITENHTISVTFAPITYTIKYNGNGATSGSTASSSHTYDEEKELTANGFSRTGYNFAGWVTKDEIGAAEATAVTNSTSMTGNVSSGSDSFGTYFTKDASSSTQWWAGLACNRFNVQSGLTYIWTIEVYHEMGKTIQNRMDANVSSSSTTGNDEAYGDSAVVTPQVIPSGVWTTLTIKVKIIDGVTSPYIHHSFCPTGYVDGTGFTTAAKIYYRNSRIVAMTENPPKYMNCEKVMNLSTKQGDVVNLYAVWAANQYTVSFEANGGTVSPTSQAAVYGQRYGALPTPTRTGYTFVDWTNSLLCMSDWLTKWHGSTNQGTASINRLNNSVTLTATGDDCFTNPWNGADYRIKISPSTTYSFSWKQNAQNSVVEHMLFLFDNQTTTTYTNGYFTESYDSATGRYYIAFTSSSTTNYVGFRLGIKNANGTTLTFSKFKLEEGSTPTEYETTNETTVKVPKNHTLYAEWKANSYNIKFSATDASITEQLWNYAGSTGYTSSNAGSYNAFKPHNNSRVAELQAVVFDSTLSCYTPIPARLGYTFAGWYSAASGGVMVANVDGSLVASVSGFTGANKQWQSAKETTLYAHWSQNSYAIEYVLNGGTKGSTSPSSYKFGTTTTISDPTRTGYTFTGWSVTATLDGKRYGTINISTGLMEYSSSYPSAVYFPLFYQKAGVSYTGKLGGGQIRWRQYLTSGEYSGNGSSSTSEAKLLSLWYHLGMSDDTTTISWDGGKSFVIDSNQVGKLTLTANWSANSYTVTANANGGTIPTTSGWTVASGSKNASKTVTFDKTYGALPTPTRTGYTFSGWYTNASGGTQVSSSTKVTTASNHSIYAHWTAKTYTVTFNPNNRGGRISTQTTDGTYSGNNMTLTYTASSHMYRLVNTSSSDPFATIGQTVYLTAGTTYLMHAEVLNDSFSVIPSSSGSIQIFYGISQGYSEANSRRFYADTTYQTFTVSTSGTYNIRIDNDCGQNVRVQNFWIYQNFTYQKTVTYGGTYGTLPTLTASSGTFVGWLTAKSGGSTVTSSTQMTTASNHTLYGSWSGNIVISVENSSYYSNVTYSTSNGKSGSISNGGSATLTNLPSGVTVTITATVIAGRLVCGTSADYFVYYGIQLNSYSNRSFNETTSNAASVSASITIASGMTSISVTGVSKTQDLCCITGDSLIYMANGTQKQVKDIVVGDKVMSYNVETHKMEPTEVNDVIKLKRKNIVNVKFADGTSIKITPDHPMFSQRGWIAYSPDAGRVVYPGVDLEEQGTQIGDMIMSLSLLFDKQVVDMEYISGEEIDVYTFSVKDNQNYFAQSVLIHNAKICVKLCCVDGETDITMADGSTKKAKDISVGDEVLSYNQETKQYEKTKIEETITPYREKILEITFEDGTILKITDDHPLLSERGWICYNPEKGRLAYGFDVSDKAMQVGDKIITEFGARTIASIKVVEFEDLEIVYTFKLANGLAYIANGNIVESAKK